MKWQFVGLAMLAVSLTVGYVDRARQVAAVVPNACPMYECRTIHAYWAGVNSTLVQAYMVAGTTNDTNNGVQNLFTDTSVEKSPLAAKDGSWDMYTYPSCSPHCGKDGNGKWQAPQSVSVAGDRSASSVLDNRDRKPCTQNGGSVGPTVPNPTNANTGSYYPPGNPSTGE